MILSIQINMWISGAFSLSGDNLVGNTFYLISEETTHCQKKKENSLKIKEKKFQDVRKIENPILLWVFVQIYPNPGPCH